MLVLGLSSPLSVQAAAVGASGDRSTYVIVTTREEDNGGEGEGEGASGATGSDASASDGDVADDASGIPAVLDLSPFLSDARIIEDGTGLAWPAQVRRGKEYGLRLEFTEARGLSFPLDDTWMEYQVPEGVSLGDWPFTQYFSVSIGSGDAGAVPGVDQPVLSGNRIVYEPSENALRIRWNTADAANFSLLADWDHAAFAIIVKARFDFAGARDAEDGQARAEIAFSDLVSGEIVEKTTDDVEISKQGAFDAEAGQIHYVVKVTSYGASQDIEVLDEVEGTALSYLADPGLVWSDPGDSSVTVAETGPAEEAGGRAATGSGAAMQDAESGKDGTDGRAKSGAARSGGFRVHIDKMADGQSITFAYSAEILADKLTDGGTSEETRNTASVQARGLAGGHAATVDFEGVLDVAGGPAASAGGQEEDAAGSPADGLSAAGIGGESAGKGGQGDAAGDGAGGGAAAPGQDAGAGAADGNPPEGREAGREGGTQAGDAAAGAPQGGELPSAPMPAQNFAGIVQVPMGAGMDTEASEADAGSRTSGRDTGAGESASGNSMVVVHVSADEGAFPAGARMSLAAPEPDALEGIARTIDQAVDGTRRGFQAVDIRFFDADGKEIEPQKPVRVTFFTSMISEAARGAHANEPVVMHIGGEETDNRTGRPQVCDAQVGDSAVIFEAASFSTYVIVYTVDFSWNGHMYSLPGGTWVWLSQVLEDLEADFGVDDLSDVSFTNEDLVSVDYVEASEEEEDAYADSPYADLDEEMARYARAAGLEADARKGQDPAADDSAGSAASASPRHDWRLTSKKSFLSTEFLTMTARDGTVRAIRVTDPVVEGGNTYYEDLRELLSNLVLYVDGEPVQDGDVVDVRDGMLYDLAISFKEGGTKQFSNTDQLYFDLPAGFVLPDDYADKLTVNLGLDGKVYGNLLSYDKENNRLLLDWNREDRKFRALAGAGNLRFTLHLRGYIRPGQVSYSPYFTIAANRYDPHNASVSKSGVLDASDPERQTVTYTVKVVSDGSTENLTLTDVAGTALSYQDLALATWQRESAMASQAEARKVEETPLGGDYSPTAPSIRASAEGFVITIPETHDGDILTFTYTCDVDYKKISHSGSASFEEMGNTVQIYGDSDPIDNKAEFHQKEVVYSDLAKSVEGPGPRYKAPASDAGQAEGAGADAAGGDADAGTADGQADAREYQDLTWTIDTNRYKLISFAGTDITDQAHVYTDSLENPVLREDLPLEYIGEGITVEVYGWNEDKSDSRLVETRQIPWSQLEIRPDYDATGGWTYHVPDEDGLYEYKITYRTRADVTGLTSDALVKNTAQSRGGVDEASVLLHPRGNGLGVKKTVLSQDEDYITWEITVFLDDIAQGFHRRLVVEDLLPHRYVARDDGSGSDLFKDTYVEDSVEVLGLQEGESYDVHDSQPSGWAGDNVTLQKNGVENRYTYRYPELTQDTNFISGERNRNVVFIEFYQDADRTVQGLQAPEGGGDSRSIRIRLKSRINQDWVRRVWDKFGYTAYWNGLKHQNDVYANTAHELAEAIVPGKHLNKTFKEKPTWTNANIWRFETYISGKQAGGKVVIDDYFDTDLWKFYSASSVQYRAGNLPHYANSVRTQGHDGYWVEGEYGSRAEEIDGGVRFTIGELPLKADGTAWPFYGVNYYLTPRDDEAWAKIQQLALEAGGMARFLNRAASEGMEDSDYYTVSLLPEFKPLVKSEPALSEKPNMVEYTLLLNQQKQRLNDGNPITVEDEFENISVDYSTIKVVTEPAGREKEVSYDYSGHVGTFVIPDETKVTVTYAALVIPPADTQWQAAGNADADNGEGSPGDAAGSSDAEDQEASVTVTNVASMLGWKDGGSKEIKISKSSEATIWRIRMFKYGSGHMEAGLNGATFGLYTREDGEYIPMQYTQGEKAGENVTFTTQNVKMLDGMIQSEEDLQSLTEEEKARLTTLDGYALVQLYQDRDGIYLDNEKTYYLYELSAPRGYAKSDIYWSFTFNRSPQYDDGAWTYYNNDILKVRNSPGDGSFSIKKVLDGNYALSDAQKAALRFTILKKTDASPDQGQAASGTDEAAGESLSPGMGTATGENASSDTGADAGESQSAAAATPSEGGGDSGGAANAGDRWEAVFVEAPVLDDAGNPALDEDGNPLYEKVSELTYGQIRDGLSVTHIGAGVFRIVESTAEGGAEVPAGIDHTVSFTRDEVEEDLTPEGSDSFVQFQITQEDIDRGLEHAFVLTDSYRQETVTLAAKKAWRNAEGNAIAPDGASVTLAAYPVDGATGLPAVDYALAVTLDGAPDVTSARETGESAAWTAQFAGLPQKDQNGKEITYVVREIAGPAGYDVEYANSASALASLADGLGGALGSIFGTSSSTSADTGLAGAHSVADAAAALSAGASSGTDAVSGESSGASGDAYALLAKAATPTITNRQQTVSFVVQKNWEQLSWRDAADQAPDGATATLGLYYGLTEAEAYAKYTSGARPYASAALPREHGANDADNAWTARFDNLPKADGAGRDYVWILVETEGYAGFTARYGEGAGNAEGASAYAAQPADTAASGAANSGAQETGNAWTVTNIEGASFHFSKLWRTSEGQAMDWQSDIDVELCSAPEGTSSWSVVNRYHLSLQEDPSTQALSVTATPENMSDASSRSVWSAAKTADGSYAFTVDGLEGATGQGAGRRPLAYAVREIQASGYKEPAYATATGQTILDATLAKDGQTIINTPADGYELPSTGGRGLLPALRGLGKLLLPRAQ